MDLGLKGGWALVTGASQGIGEGIARTLAREGVNLHLTARSADRLAAVRDDIAATHGTEVRIHPLDITAHGACEALAAACPDIDILVNNAGAIPGGGLAEVDEQAWRTGWDLKVFGTINLCRLVYPAMKARGGGVIVNVIGNGGEMTDPLYIAGTTGNAGLMAFTRALGGRSLDDGIRVVGVNPGPTDTDRIRTLLKKRAATQLGDASRYRELEADFPLGRPAHVREIADLVAFLASDLSGYTTGTIVTVDGGIVSRR
jgi:NAD(P)-dependent dehydrogenase (short-subunit alcohol dehydrogenase family)